MTKQFTRFSKRLRISFAVNDEHTRYIFNGFLKIMILSTVSDLWDTLYTWDDELFNDQD
jgi:hypothetical protein